MSDSLDGLFPGSEAIAVARDFPEYEITVEAGKPVARLRTATKFWDLTLGCVHPPAQPRRQRRDP